MDETNQNKTSRSQIKAVMKYKSKTYKRLAMDLRPELIDEIKAAAAREGLSVTSYLVGLHKKHIEEQNGENSQ
ncbi:MAG: hypothetical protein IK093_01680 [Ruminiclostridium sp.]|nr:hypothetical protein [Ruminiclostridium sp.]